MSYLSAPGNVGYSGLSQISDASCANQYKMGVDTAVASARGEEEDLSYFPHVAEPLFSTKFKMDPTELFTFQEADGVAGEITVCDDAEVEPSVPRKDPSAQAPRANGFIKTFTKAKYATVTNGHFPDSKPKVKAATKPLSSARSPSRGKNSSRSNSISEILASVPQSTPAGSPGTTLSLPSPNRNSISSFSKEPPQSTFSSLSNSQSFLDVFKREMGTCSKAVTKNEPTAAKESKSTAVKKEPVVVKKEPGLPAVKSEVKPIIIKKSPSGERAGKSSAACDGRGPALHEALQRIPSASTAATNAARPGNTWHAPGPYAFECTPLSDKKHSVTAPGSSDDDQDMPNFGSWVLTSADDAEAGGGDARGARLAARRATLRRQVAHAATALRLAPTHRRQASLAHTLKKHLSQGSGGTRLPSQLMTPLLNSLGMSSVLSTRERRRLRCGGWSGGEVTRNTVACVAEGCGAEAMPCASYCLAHVTLAPEQRLYASCAAVFAGGARCSQPLLQLNEQTPLCVEHAWKRDNYDKISRECKPKKVAPRKRPVSTANNRRAKRRRRPPPPPRPAPPATSAQAHTSVPPASDMNVCSNSSTYDSSEDTGIGGLSETEFMAAASDHASLEVGVTEHVLAQQPPDDILDSSVLHQIPDEAFTEFFNQTEGGSVGGFAESEELARALEAVLDERVLDSLTDCVFTHSMPAASQHNKVAAPGMEMSSSTTS